MDEQRVTSAIQSLAGLTYKEWQVIEQQVNHEFKRLANKNVLERTELLTKNVRADLNVL